MNETAILTRANTGQGIEFRAPVHKHLLAWAAAVLIGWLSLLAWVQFEEQHLRSAAKATAAASSAGGIATEFTTGRVADLLHWAMLITAGGGAVFLLVLAIGLRFWQRSWARRCRTQESEYRGRLNALQVKLAESRQNEQLAREQEGDFQAKITELSRQVGVLQGELDRRKRTELSLSQQRQSLESSKAVLELHVQARTQELQKLKSRYELILNAAGEGICGFDSEGKATFVNPAVARATGWSVEELLGKTEPEIFYPKDAAPGAAASPNESGELLFYRKDGTKFPVEFVRTRIEEGGRQTGSVLLFKDITERKRADETLSQRAAELARSNAELEQFAFVASHDLQEPLRKIQAFGDRLKMKCDGMLSPDALDYLSRMQSASARMRTLIDDLLAFSRVIRSSEPFVKVDLTQITKDVVSDLEVRLEKSGGKVEIDELPAVEADPTQMRQLMQNLVGNALKFQAPGSQPLVKVQGRTFNSLSGEAFAEIVVQDNGIGFEEQYAEKIFVVFQRLHGRGEYEGTGVGLAVCRRITDRHHGTILASSKPGQGSTFTVTLPLHQPKPQTAS